MVVGHPGAKKLAKKLRDFVLSNVNSKTLHLMTNGTWLCPLFYNVPV